MYKYTGRPLVRWTITGGDQAVNYAKVQLITARRAADMVGHLVAKVAYPVLRRTGCSVAGKPRFRWLQPSRPERVREAGKNNAVGIQAGDIERAWLPGADDPGAEV